MSVPSNGAGHKTINHGPNVTCTESTFWSVFLFFLTNYIIHCVTLKPYPGESLFEQSFAAFWALLLPASGIIRAVDSLRVRTRFRRGNDVQKACVSGALCMVVRRQDWLPRDGDRLDRVLDPESMNGIVAALQNDRRTNPYENITFAANLQKWTPYVKYSSMTYKPPDINREHHRDINGMYILPHGYRFEYVPTNSRVVPTTGYDWTRKNPYQDNQKSTPKQEVAIASNYSFPKALFAIFQTVNAAVTLYRARGDQIDQYGFAAFGLTVIPYTIMSFLNLMAQIATPDYSALFMVETPEMLEARERGGKFDGVVGRVVTAEEPERPHYVFTKTDNKHLFQVKEYSYRPAYGESPSPTNVYFQFYCSPTDPSVHKAYYQACSNFDFKDDRLPVRRNNWAIQFGAPILAFLLCLFIMYLLSHFRIGKSTISQRGWVISWLTTGMASGALATMLFRYSAGLRTEMSLIRSGKRKPRETAIMVCACILFFGIFTVPALGGLIVVAKMLGDYGTCERKLGG